MYQLTPQRSAILDTINWAEGSPGYNELYSYVPFNNLAPHPNTKICAGAFCSTAAGAYQFLYSTWQNTINALGIADYMDETSQDQGALYLIDYRDALQDIDNGNIESAINKISWEWASLPPYRYEGQGTKTMEEVINYYNERLEYYNNDGLGIFFNDTFTPVNEVNGLTISIMLFVIALIIYFVVNRKSNA